MGWDAVDAPDIGQDLILFDGDCVLCSRWARFVHERDTVRRFKFVAIQSEYGAALAIRATGEPAPFTSATPRRRMTGPPRCAAIHFDVPVALPLIGRLTHYSGWLALEEVEAALAPSERETA